MGQTVSLGVEGKVQGAALAKDGGMEELEGWDLALALIPKGILGQLESSDRVEEFRKTFK